MLLRALAWLAIAAQLIGLTVAHKHVPTVFFVRHGEKPLDGSNGLNKKGLQRSLCLTDVFNQHSRYDIDYIIAPRPLEDGSGWRSFDTVTPLASKLGLKVDTSCHRDAHHCAAKLIKKYRGKGNVLVAWQHDGLHGIAEEMGYWFPEHCSRRDFDKIWEFPKHVDGKFREESQCCPKLDKCGRKNEDAQEDL